MREAGPTGRAAVDSCACPLATVAVPRVVAPFMNCTVPVALAGVIAAVSVRDCPALIVVALAESVVVELALFTVCGKAEDVLPLVFASPEEIAVREFVPTGSDAVAICAMLLAMVAVPNSVGPLKNCTVPVVGGQSVAVSVTLCPNVEGEGLAETVVVRFALTTVITIALEVLG